MLLKWTLQLAFGLLPSTQIFWAHVNGISRSLWSVAHSWWILLLCSTFVIVGSLGFCDQRCLLWANSPKVRGASSLVSMWFGCLTWGKTSWLFLSLILHFCCLGNYNNNLKCLYLYILWRIFYHKSFPEMPVSWCVDYSSVPSFLCVCLFSAVGRKKC